MVRACLGPDLADVLPGGHLGVDQGQRLHHLLGALARGVAPDRQDHDLVRSDAQRLANRRHLRVVAVARDEAIGVATDRQNLDVLAGQPVAGVDVLTQREVTRISGRLSSTSW